MSYTPLTSHEVAQSLGDIRDPNFKVWTWYAYAQGQLDLLAQSIVQAGKAQSSVEAILYMADYIHTKENGNGKKVSWRDIAQTPFTGRIKELTELVTGTSIQSSHDITRLYGIISHLAIPDLLSGKLITTTKPPRTRKKRYVRTQQLSMFQTPVSLELFQNGNGTTYLGPKFVPMNIIDETIDLWEELQIVMLQNPLPVHHKYYKKLLRHLRVIFGDYYISKVLSLGIMKNQYLEFLTLMSWASAVAVFKWSGNIPIFKEAFILPWNYDLGVGRIDALSVMHVNGIPPTEGEKARVQKMTLKKYPSVGHVMQDLEQTFGENLSLHIRDWKFAVGDGVKGMRKRANNGFLSENIIRADELGDHPLLDHEEQLKRYLSLSLLSYVLVSGKMEKSESLWDQKFSLRGSDVYFLPDQLPKIFDITLDTENTKRVFEEQVVSNFNVGLRSSSMRHISNNLISHAIRLNHGDDKQSKKAVIPPQGVFEKIIETCSIEHPDIHGNEALKKLIEESHVPVFEDEYHIFEVVGRRPRGKKMIELHVDTLIERIQDGTIIVSKAFNTVRGGAIMCLMHGDTNPSMHVSFRKGIFKCFVCGACGTFHPDSIPDDIHVLIKPGKMLLRENRETEKMAIPMRHQEIMHSAQEIFQDTFWKSRGERYLKNERKLDPDRSRAHGAGFAVIEKWLHGLLDRGFTYDELITYGFLGISGAVRSNRAIDELLRRGMDINSLYRPTMIKSKVKGQRPVMGLGLPYPIFDEYVTYPLDVRGVINNFYGRAIKESCPKNFRHRKLPNDRVDDMPHGGFNMTKAMEAKEILVVEAAINADTLLQTSDFEAVCAIVGINNKFLWEELAEYEGTILIAFDHDVAKYNKKGQLVEPPGQKNTLRLMEELQLLGFRGQVIDFTAEFVRQHPNIVYNDPNQYWVDTGNSISVQRTLEYRAQEILT